MNVFHLVLLKITAFGRLGSDFSRCTGGLGEGVVSEGSSSGGPV